MPIPASKTDIEALIGKALVEIGPDGTLRSRGLIVGAVGARYVLVEFCGLHNGNEMLGQRVIKLAELSETDRHGNARFRMFPDLAAASRYVTANGAAADAQIRGRPANTQVQPLRPAPPPQPAPDPDLVDDLM
jgi:hypothetical protein